MRAIPDRRPSGLNPKPPTKPTGGFSTQGVNKTGKQSQLITFSTTDIDLAGKNRNVVTAPTVAADIGKSITEKASSKTNSERVIATRPPKESSRSFEIPGSQVLPKGPELHEKKNELAIPKIEGGPQATQKIGTETSSLVGSNEPMDTSERTIIHMDPNNRASVLSNIGNILEPSIANLSPATKSNTLLFKGSGTKKEGLAKWKKKG